MRVARSLAALTLLLSLLGSAFAHAEPRECVVRDRSFGVCLRYGGSTPAPGGGHENPDRGRRKTDAPQCQFQGKPSRVAIISAHGCPIARCDAAPPSHRHLPHTRCGKDATAVSCTAATAPRAPASPIQKQSS